jgi:hypothetical protein
VTDPDDWAQRFIRKQEAAYAQGAAEREREAARDAERRREVQERLQRSPALIIPNETQRRLIEGRYAELRYVDGDWRRALASCTAPKAARSAPTSLRERSCAAV